MTKAEIINKVSELTGMSRKDAIEALEIFLSAIKDGLKQGEKVSLVGFGTFYVKHKRSRNGRNPRTGEQIQIPPKQNRHLQAGQGLPHGGQRRGGYRRRRLRRRGRRAVR